MYLVQQKHLPKKNIFQQYCKTNVAFAFVPVRGSLIESVDVCFNRRQTAGGGVRNNLRELAEKQGIAFVITARQNTALVGLKTKSEWGAFTSGSYSYLLVLGTAAVKPSFHPRHILYADLPQLV